MTIDYDIPLDTYHQSPQLSTSKLSDYAKRGPRFFAMRHVSRTSSGFESSEAQIFGQRFENLLCDQEELDGRFAIKPEGMSFATVDGKAWRAAQVGKTIVKAEDVEAMNGMRESFLENESAVALVRAAKLQATIRAPYAGTPGIQSRPDWLLLDGCPLTGYEPATIDLKTTISLAKMVSGRGVLDYAYHAQGALCRETLRCNGIAARSYLIACEKVKPYRCQVIEVTTPWLDCGWQWCERQLGRLAVHYASGDWPRVERELVQLGEPPPWASRVDDSDEEAA